jgi:4'-phosphopantetheinyl transferase
MWSRNTASNKYLPHGQVDLWRVGLEMSDSALSRLSATLSEDESRRAERFRFPVLRRRFSAGRGALRAILGGYLSTEPERLRFACSSHGKPSLLNSSDNIQFNVSKSDDLMVAAVCREWPVGVDIEKEDPRFHAMDIAQRFFCERERNEIARCDGAAALRAFFQFWTAKEAVLKATSLGLALDLCKLEIGLRPLRILALEDAAKIHGGSWHLTAFSPGEGYSGALAVAAEPSRLKHLDFLPPSSW